MSPKKRRATNAARLIKLDFRFRVSGYYLTVKVCDVVIALPLEPVALKVTVRVPAELKFVKVNRFIDCLVAKPGQVCIMDV